MQYFRRKSKENARFEENKKAFTEKRAFAHLSLSRQSRQRPSEEKKIFEIF